MAPITLHEFQKEFIDQTSNKKSQGVYYNSLTDQLNHRCSSSWSRRINESVQEFTMEFDYKTTYISSLAKLSSTRPSFMRLERKKSNFIYTKISDHLNHSVNVLFTVIEQKVSVNFTFGSFWLLSGRKRNVSIEKYFKL